MNKPCIYVETSVWSYAFAVLPIHLKVVTKLSYPTE